MFKVTITQNHDKHGATVMIESTSIISVEDAMKEALKAANLIEGQTLKQKDAE